MAEENKKPHKDEEKKQKKSPLWKIILKISIWVFSCLAALLVLMFIFKDSLLHFSITCIGSSITGVEISLDKIETSVSRGDIKLVNLRIGNPEGFDSPSMLELGSFYFALDTDSVFSDQILIKSIEVKDLTVTGDITADNKFNINTLIKNMQEKFAPQQESDVETVAASLVPVTDANDDTAAPAPKVNIQSFRIENVAVNFKDAREDICLEGFSIFLQKLEGSLTEGDILLDNFHIRNPNGYSVEHMLRLDSISVKIDPETLMTSGPVVNSFDIQGLDAVAEFKKNGNFNVLEVAETMMEQFAPEEKARIDDQATQEPAAETPDDTAENEPAAEAENTPTTESGSPEKEGNSPSIKELFIGHSSFTVQDDRIGVPITLPIHLAVSEYKIEINGKNIFLEAYAGALWLRDQCFGVADAGQFVVTQGKEFLQLTTGKGVELLNETTGKGVELLNETTGKGVELLQETTGIDIDIQGAAQSGQKMLEGVLDIFQ